MGLFLAFWGTLLFSLKPVVVKLAYQHGIDSNQLISLRMLISSPLYLGLLFWHHKRTPISTSVVRRYWPLLIASGLSGYYLASLLDLWGLEYISAQLERLILFTYPGFVMLLSLLIWRKLPSLIMVLAFFCTYAGVGVVFGGEIQQQGSDVLLGSALVLLSAFLFAIYLVMSKRGIQALGSQVFTCIASLIASMAVGLHMLATADVQLIALPWQAYGWAGVMSVVCTVIPSLMIAGGIARLGPQLVSILGGMGPILTAFLAVVILHEPFGVSHLVGTALVVIGAWLVVFESRDSEKSSANANIR